MIQIKSTYCFGSRRHAGLQLPVAWMYGDYVRNLVLQISPGTRATQVLARQQTGNLPSLNN